MSNLSIEDEMNPKATKRFPSQSTYVTAFIISLNTFLPITAFLGNVFILIALLTGLITSQVLLFCYAYDTKVSVHQ